MRNLVLNVKLREVCEEPRKQVNGDDLRMISGLGRRQTLYASVRNGSNTAIRLTAGMGRKQTLAADQFATVSKSHPATISREECLACDMVAAGHDQLCRHRKPQIPLR